MKMRAIHMFAAAVLICGTALAAESAALPAYITAAIAAPERPAADSAQDVNRKPGAVLAFSGVKPGWKVVDLMPGSGYYTRLFSAVVGSKGKVYALQPAEMDKAAPNLQNLKGLAATPAYGNVTVLLQPAAAISLPEPVDMVWTSQNYHDLHDPFMGSQDMLHFDKTVFDALKPGGLFLVLDHAAPAGSGLTDTDTLHRIDPAAVKAELAKAGFEFVGESPALQNPADDGSKSIYDKSLRGKTNRFIYLFRRPAR